MYFDFLVKIPENTGKISLNRRNGTTYVEYTYGRRYVPEKNIMFRSARRLERWNLLIQS